MTYVEELEQRIAELEAALLEQVDLTIQLRDQLNAQSSLRDKFDLESG